jgi:nucleoid DNA-binding protein
MSLRKAQLVSFIATDTGLTQKKSAEALRVLLDILIESLRSGDSVKIRGFGKFHLRNQKERKIRHPITGKTITVGRKNNAKFRSFKALHKAINYFDFDLNEFNTENQLILQQLYKLIEYSGDYEEEQEEEEDMF